MSLLLSLVVAVGGGESWVWHWKGGPVGRENLVPRGGVEPSRVNVGLLVGREKNPTRDERSEILLFSLLFSLAFHQSLIPPKHDMAWSI